MKPSSTHLLFQEIQSHFDLSLPSQCSTQQISIQSAEEWAQRMAQSSLFDACVLLAGDASTRRYYRVTAGQKKYILMKMESFWDHGKGLPFLEIQAYLKHHGVEVPEVFETDPQRGLIFLEDLGDVTLLRKLNLVRTPVEEQACYEKAIHLLVHLQKAEVEFPSQGKIQAHQLSFDFEKLFWEVNHTIEHLYRIYLKRHLKQKDEQGMRDSFEKICRFLEGRPRTLVHRDYHSRNIMITPLPSGEEKWVMIDFQDARMGAFSYDLVSLLKDSYYSLSVSQVDSFIDFYWRQTQPIQKMNFEQFLYEFDLMTVQRNFKAIGSFASFYNRRGDPTYLKFIGNTFQNIQQVLMKYSEYKQLRSLLFDYYSF